MRRYLRTAVATMLALGTVLVVSSNAFGQEEAIGLSDDFKVVEVEEVLDVFKGEPVLISEGHFEPDRFCEPDEGFPEGVVVVDDNSGIGTGDLVETAEKALKVVQVSQKA